MKRLITLCILLSVILLTGCEYTYARDPNRVYQYTAATSSSKPNLTESQYALLFNGGLDKVILTSKTGAAFTVVVPRYYTQTRLEDRVKGKIDFHITVIPPGTYYDEDGNQVADRTLYSLDYVSRDNIDDYNPFIYRTEALSNISDEDNYDEGVYENYDMYVESYTQEIDKMLPEPTNVETDVMLTGKEEPMAGTVYKPVVVVDGITYHLPMLVYRFFVKGNYLFLRITTESIECESLFDATTYTNLANGTGANAKLIKQLELGDELYNNMLGYADEFMKYVIYGDCTEYLQVDENARVRTLEQGEQEDSISENDPITDAVNEAIEDFITSTTEDKDDKKDEETAPVKDNPSKTTTETKQEPVVVEEEDGYYDYNTEGGEYFDF